MPTPTVEWRFENLDPANESYEDSGNIENLDPAKEFEEESYVLPDYAKGYGTGEAIVTGLGRGFTKMGRSVQDLTLAAAELLSDTATAKKYKEKRENLKKLTAEEGKYWEEGLANKKSGVSGWAKGGEFAGEVLPSMIIPGSKAASLGGRAIGNAMRQGLFNTATTQGDAIERSSSGMTGAIGGGLGSAGFDILAKGVAGASGKWTDDAIKRMNDRLVEMGLKPRIGDLANRKDSSLIRGMENLTKDTPIFKGSRVIEQEKLRNLIVPDEMTGVNQLTKSVKNTDEAIRVHADSIYAPVKNKIGKTSIRINPSNMYSHALELRKNYPKIFDDSYYKREDINFLNEFIDNPTSLSYDEFRKIQQMLGKAQGRAESLVNKGELIGEAIGDAKQAYKASKVDFDTWGQRSSPATRKRYAAIVKEHNAATERWENEVLPWKQNDVANELRMINKFGAPDSAKALTKADVQMANQVRNYLRRFGPEGNADIADALTVMRRDARALGNSIDEDVVHTGPLLSGVIAPVAFSGVTGATKLSANKFVKPIYFGDSMPVMNSIPMRGFIGAGAETGDDQLSTLLVIKEIINKIRGGGDGERSIGSLTEMGANAGEGGARK